MTQLVEISRALDELLGTRGVPDYTNALNGVQVAHRGPVKGIAASVDLSMATINGAVASGANLLLVHHGLFWGGLQPLAGGFYNRIRALIENDVALFASHLPLDAHPIHGNNVLLAKALGLAASGGFAQHQGVPIGVMGLSDLETAQLVQRAARVASEYGTQLRTTRIPPGHRTRRWGICSGAGASSDTMHEALALKLDTVVVGEGPHWTAVDAPDSDLVIIYAGHYATETFGIKSVAAWASERFQLPWSFIDSPTGF